MSEDVAREPQTYFRSSLLASEDVAQRLAQLGIEPRSPDY